jgi:hypothetical protein
MTKMYKLMPVEPTGEMLERALHDLGTPNPKESKVWLRSFYRAMTAAAPSPWRPIDEAPKDGTPVLVHRKSEEGWEREIIGVDRFLYGAWNKSRRDMQPTHFIPLEWLGTPGGE